MESYNALNRREGLRLKTLVEQMREENFGRVVREGWTVASILAHLAFWDRRQLALVTAWKRAGVSAAPIDVESVNEAVRELSEALAPREAARLAVEAAEAIDREVESISAEFAEAIEAAGHGRVLRRHFHRAAHLDEIERALEREV